MPKKKKKPPSAKRRDKDHWQRVKVSQDWMKHLVNTNQKHDEWMREHEYRKYQDD